MHRSYHQQIQQWLTNTREIPSFKELDSALVQHIATCAVCRGALLLLFTQLCHINLDAQAFPCEACQEDLAAYLEIERTEGIAAAVKEFPAVWWHLWLCSTCAETYRMTNTIIDAKARGELNLPLSVPLVKIPVKEPIFRLPLRRVRIRQLNRASALFGVAWGNDTHSGVVIEEHVSNGYRLTVSVQQQADTTWRVTVHVVPPVDGYAILIADSSVWKAAFNRTGEATIDTLPGSLFLDPDGPDLMIDVEQHLI